MKFDLNQHFNKFSNNLFYDQKSYLEFKLDVEAFSSKLKLLTAESVVGLKIRSPYLAMVALLACFMNEKLAVMISHLEADLMIEKLKSQIKFEFMITDSNFDNLTHNQNNFFPEINFNKPSLVVFSSGTTSIPKGVALTFKNLYFSALGFSQFFSQQETESSLINLPHHHVAGMMILWRAFFSGGKVVTDYSESVDFISLVPLQLKRILDDKKMLEILKRIRVILIGGAALTPSLKKEAELHELKLFETYGMSETASLITVNGEILPYRELKLDDSGFFNVRGEILASGYFEKQTFIPYGPGRFKTNDIGKMTSDGKFYFVERADLIFISGGENINPLLVEEIAKNHPEIFDAYLIPVSDGDWGDAGVLLYDACGKNLTTELKSLLKTSLHPHLVPKFFFSISLRFEGQLKPKRSDLKTIASRFYLESLFSFKFIKHEDPSTPVLVLFHGFMEDKNDLLEAINPLSSKYSLLSIDLPGHGQTKIENFNGLHDIFQKLTNFIKLFSSTPRYYGYSMGGRIALQIALQYFPPVQLFLESASLGLCDEKEKCERLNADKLLFDGINQQEIGDFLKKWYANPMFETYSTLATFKKDCDKKSLHDLWQWKESQIFMSIGTFPTIALVMEQIKQSTFAITYISGEKDKKYKSMAQQLMNLKRPNLQAIEISGAGHNPHKTHPMEITSILTKIR